jgi:two-component system, response regulator PdtaR
MTRRYLIVDDNASFAENLAEVLGDIGAEATVAVSGAEALRAAADRRFDALVTDMRMPLMSGARLVHKIRRIDPGLPAVIVTAYTAEDDLGAARDEGLLAILPKPVPLDRLLELLRLARRNGLVALVDDDAGLADNLSEALRDRGFSAVTARSVAEADRIGGVQPFAAVVDVRIPGAPDGEALRRLLERAPTLPVIVMSAYPEALNGVSAAHVFEKPFATGKLLDALERVHAEQRR